MSTTASQITSVTIVYSTVSGADQRKHQSSLSLSFVRGIHRWPVNSLHKGSVTREMFPFDDVIMTWITVEGLKLPVLMPASQADRKCEKKFMFRRGSWIYRLNSRTVAYSEQYANLELMINKHTHVRNHWYFWWLSHLNSYFAAWEPSLLQASDPCTEDYSPYSLRVMQPLGRKSVIA